MAEDRESQFMRELNMEEEYEEEDEGEDIEDYEVENTEDATFREEDEHDEEYDLENENSSDIHVVSGASQISELSSTSLLTTYDVRVGHKGALSTKRQGNSRRKVTPKQNFFRLIGPEKAAFYISEFSRRNKEAGNNALKKAHANSVIKFVLSKFPKVTVKMLLEAFGVGMGRLDLIRKDRCYLSTRGRSSNMFSKVDIDAFRSFFDGLDLEPGYACSHRRQKM